MKDVYENKTLGISVDDFEAPEKITIPIDCDNFDSNKFKLIGIDEDLEDLGF